MGDRTNRQERDWQGQYPRGERDRAYFGKRDPLSPPALLERDTFGARAPPPGPFGKHSRFDSPARGDFSRERPPPPPPPPPPGRPGGGSWGFPQRRSPHRSPPNRLGHGYPGLDGRRNSALADERITGTSFDRYGGPSRGLLPGNSSWEGPGREPMWPPHLERDPWRVPVSSIPPPPPPLSMPLPPPPPIPAGRRLPTRPPVMDYEVGELPRTESPRHSHSSSRGPGLSGPSGGLGEERPAKRTRVVSPLPTTLSSLPPHLAQLEAALSCGTPPGRGRQSGSATGCGTGGGVGGEVSSPVIIPNDIKLEPRRPVDLEEIEQRIQACRAAESSAIVPSAIVPPAAEVMAIPEEPTAAAATIETPPPCPPGSLTPVLGSGGLTADAPAADDAPKRSRPRLKWGQGLNARNKLPLTPVDPGPAPDAPGETPALGNATTPVVTPTGESPLPLPAGVDAVSVGGQDAKPAPSVATGDAVASVTDVGGTPLASAATPLASTRVPEAREDAVTPRPPPPAEPAVTPQPPAAPAPPSEVEVLTLKVVEVDGEIADVEKTIAGLTSVLEEAMEGATRVGAECHALATKPIPQPSLPPLSEDEEEEEPEEQLPESSEEIPLEPEDVSSDEAEDMDLLPPDTETVAAEPPKAGPPAEEDGAPTAEPVVKGQSTPKGAVPMDVDSVRESPAAGKSPAATKPLAAATEPAKTPAAIGQLILEEEPGAKPPSDSAKTPAAIGQLIPEEEPGAKPPSAARLFAAIKANSAKEDSGSRAAAQVRSPASKDGSGARGPSAAKAISIDAGPRSAAPLRSQSSLEGSAGRAQLVAAKEDSGSRANAAVKSPLRAEDSAGRGALGGKAPFVKESSGGKPDTSRRVSGKAALEKEAAVAKADSGLCVADKAQPLKGEEPGVKQDTCGKAASGKLESGSRQGSGSEGQLLPKEEAARPDEPGGVDRCAVAPSQSAALVKALEPWPVKNGKRAQNRALGPVPARGKELEPAVEDASGEEEDRSDSDDDVVTSDIVQSLLCLARPRPEIVPQVYATNHLLARTAVVECLELLPPELHPKPGDMLPPVLYKTIGDFPGFEKNLRRLGEQKEAMYPVIKHRMKKRRREWYKLGRQYSVLLASWREHAAKYRLSEPALPPPPIPTGRRGSGTPAAMGRLSARSNSRNQVVPLHDPYDDDLLAKEAEGIKRLKNMCELPTQLLTRQDQAKARFLSNNGLVEDPEADLALEDAVRPWSAEEKRVFFDKFLAHPKDFSRIASYLEYRTTADCVAFYYKTQKLDDFAAVRRKQQLKKRRQQSEYNRSTTYLGMVPAAARVVEPAYARTFGRPITSYLDPTPTAPRTTKPRNNARKPARGRQIAAEPPAPTHTALAYAVEMSGGILKQEEDNSNTWTVKEEASFLEGVRRHGRNHQAITAHMGNTRSLGAVKSFFSKNKRRFNLDQMVEDWNARQRDEEEYVGLGPEAGALPHDQDGSPEDPGLALHSTESLQEMSPDRDDPEHDHEQATAAQMRMLEAGGARGGLLDAQQGARGGGGGGGARGANGGGPHRVGSGALGVGMGALSLPGNHALAAGALLNQQYLARTPETAALAQMMVLQNMQNHLNIHHNQVPNFLGAPNILASMANMAGMGVSGPMPQLPPFNPATMGPGQNLALMQLLQGGHNPYIIPPPQQPQPYAAVSQPGFPFPPGFPAQMSAQMQQPMLQSLMQIMQAQQQHQQQQHTNAFLQAQQQAAAQQQQQQHRGSGDGSHGGHVGPSRDSGNDDRGGRGGNHLGRAKTSSRGEAGDCGTDGGDVVQKRTHTVVWSEEDKAIFMDVWQKYGKDYDKLMAALPNKTAGQIRNYIQNYSKKLNLDERAPKGHAPKRRQRADSASRAASGRATPAVTPPPDPVTTIPARDSQFMPPGTSGEGFNDLMRKLHQDKVVTAETFAILNAQGLVPGAQSLAEGEGTPTGVGFLKAAAAQGGFALPAVKPEGVPVQSDDLGRSLPHPVESGAQPLGAHNAVGPREDEGGGGARPLGGLIDDSSEAPRNSAPLAGRKRARSSTPPVTMRPTITTGGPPAPRPSAPSSVRTGISGQNSLVNILANLTSQQTRMGATGEGRVDDFRQGVLSGSVGGGPTRPASEVLPQRPARQHTQILDELLTALNNPTNRTKLSPPLPLDVSGGARPLSAVSNYGAVAIGAPLQRAPAAAAVPLGPPGFAPPAAAANGGADAEKPPASPAERAEQPVGLDGGAPRDAGGEEAARGTGGFEERGNLVYGNGDFADDGPGKEPTPQENGGEHHQG